MQQEALKALNIPYRDLLYYNSRNFVFLFYCCLSHSTLRFVEKLAITVCSCASFLQEYLTLWVWMQTTSANCWHRKNKADETRASSQVWMWPQRYTVHCRAQGPEPDARSELPSMTVGCLPALRFINECLPSSSEMKHIILGDVPSIILPQF